MPGSPALPPRVRQRLGRHRLLARRTTALLTASLLLPLLAAIPGPAVAADETPVITIDPPALDAQVGDYVFATVTLTGTTEAGSATLFGPNGRLIRNGYLPANQPTELAFDTSVATAAVQRLYVSGPGVTRAEEYAIRVERAPSTIVVEPLSRATVGRFERWAVGVRVLGVLVRGEQVGGDNRDLILERRARHGWVIVDRRRSHIDRAVSMSMPTNWAGIHRLRLSVLSRTTHAEAFAPLGTMTRIRSYRLRPETSFAFADTPDARPARLNACTSHGSQIYVVNVEQAPAFGEALVRRAFRRVGEATGYRSSPPGTAGPTLSPSPTGTGQRASRASRS